MEKKVILGSVILVRDGKRVSPPIGKAFKLSADEVKGLRKDIDYRDAVNEDQEADEAEVVGLRNSPHVGKPKTNARGAGNTTAMADGADGAAPTTDAGQTADSNKGKTPAKPANKPAADDDL